MRYVDAHAFGFPFQTFVKGDNQMSNQAATSEEPERLVINSEKKNLSLTVNVINKDDVSPPFPSEHVPTFIINDQPLIMNVNRNLELMSSGSGVFQFRYPESPFLFRRVAVVAKLFGVSELIYQNVNPKSLVKLWLLDTAEPQITFDNRSDGNELKVTVDQNLSMMSMNDPDLGNRVIHTRSSSGGSERIKKIVIVDDQNRELFQNFEARDYNIFFFRTHE